MSPLKPTGKKPGGSPTGRRRATSTGDGPVRAHRRREAVDRRLQRRPRAVDAGLRQPTRAHQSAGRRHFDALGRRAERRRCHPADARVRAVAAAGVRSRRVEVERAVPQVAAGRRIREASKAVVHRRRVGEAKRGAAAEQSASFVIEMAPLASQSAPDVKVAYPLSTAPPRSARRAFMMLASSKVGNATCSGPASEENAPAGARPAPIMSRRANRAIAFR